MSAVNLPTADAALPYRSLAAADLETQTHRFSWGSVTQNDHCLYNPRNHLVYGGNEDPIDTEIDRIPVNHRLEVLTQLSNCFSRVALRQFYRQGIQVPDPDEKLLKYTRFMIGSGFLEFELFEIFLRNTPTASDIVKQMRAFAASKWNVSMNYISPRMIMDWSWLYRMSQQFRIEIPRSESASVQKNSSVSPRTLINLATFSLKLIIGNRIHRLKATGYENIDL